MPKPTSRERRILAQMYPKNPIPSTDATMSDTEEPPHKKARKDPSADGCDRQETPDAETENAREIARIKVRLNEQHEMFETNEALYTITVNKLAKVERLIGRRREEDDFQKEIYGLHDELDELDGAPVELKGWDETQTIKDITTENVNLKRQLEAQNVVLEQQKATTKHLMNTLTVVMQRLTEVEAAANQSKKSEAKEKPEGTDA
ncbi:hypothetical protein F53441_5839 [Fusarium austroafricanum]|uniref:Uncharacterized protein n=1 Tax=Fusarium austroafricanum TaxID=2364996 RepID=A0A8H4NX99_9HYPO|nr:hypothetical protein F53441_5839 [Fusarium austroafricanum]